MMELNKIYLGSCYDLIKQVDDKSVNCIMTDPPYKIEGLHPGTGILKVRGLSTYVEEMRSANLGAGIDYKILDDLVRVMKKINIYIWCNKEQIYDYIDFFCKKHKCHFEIIIWGKVNCPPFVGGHYLKDKEYCLYFWEPGAYLKGTYDTMKTVYMGQTNIADKKEYGHPTIKDFNISKTILSNSLKPGDTFLDLYSGSGTFCAVAKSLGANYIGFEIDPTFL